MTTLKTIFRNQSLVQKSLEAVIWSHPSYTVTTQNVIRLFLDQGIDCYITGGSPRDWLQGKISVDTDISINAPISEAKRLLLETYPVDEAFLWYYDDFGLIGWGDSEANHMDINILRDYRQSDVDTFQPQSTFALDYQTRDFTINCFYYSVREEVLHDPTGYAIQDIKNMLLRVNADEATYATNHSLTFRIAKFLMKGYAMHASCHDYLLKHMGKDLTGFSDREFHSFESAQIAAKGLSVDQFRDNLQKLARDHGSLEIIRSRPIYSIDR